MCIFKGKFNFNPSNYHGRIYIFFQFSTTMLPYHVFIPIIIIYIYYIEILTFLCQQKM